MFIALSDIVTRHGPGTHLTVLRPESKRFVIDAVLVLVWSDPTISSGDYAVLLTRHGLFSVFAPSWWACVNVSCPRAPPRGTRDDVDKFPWLMALEPRFWTPVNSQ
jgi:hypothetical protein